MCVGFSVVRVTELWMPPRACVISLPGTFTIFSCAWYIMIIPFGTRWETTARAQSAPLVLKASIQSLSSIPASAASTSDSHTIGPPRERVSISRLSV